MKSRLSEQYSKITPSWTLWLPSYWKGRCIFEWMTDKRPHYSLFLFMRNLLNVCGLDLWLHACSGITVCLKWMENKIPQYLSWLGPMLLQNNLFLTVSGITRRVEKEQCVKVWCCHFSVFAFKTYLILFLQQWYDKMVISCFCHHSKKACNAVLLQVAKARYSKIWTTSFQS